MVVSLERGANDLHMVQLMPLSPPSSLAPVKSRMLYLSSAGLPRFSWKKAIVKWMYAKKLTRTNVSKMTSFVSSGI